MLLTIQILCAVALDFVLGDPRRMPHPVRGIAWLAMRLEPSMRRAVRHERLAGVAAALTVYAVTGLAAWGVIRLAGLVHPVAGDLAGVLAVYTAMAARDLARHAQAVRAPLAAGDLPAARERVAMIVGRDTQCLDPAGVTRAAVESVAENTVDGVTAPLFWALVAGPVGALVYRAVNTLDSMFGHKDARYLRFGWLAARVDDAANYLPARLTAALMAPAAALLNLRARAAWRVLRRDGRRHESPNAGLPEAAMAGALGLQLGGLCYYDGEPLAKPAIGDAREEPRARHVGLAVAMMWTTLALFLAMGLAARWLVWRNGL